MGSLYIHGLRLMHVHVLVTNIITNLDLIFLLRFYATANDTTVGSRVIEILTTQYLRKYAFLFACGLIIDMQVGM
jgi:hypothetical protein